MRVYRMYLLAVLAVTMVARNALATNQTYYGGTSNNWAYYDNWWSGTVPAAGDNVFVHDADNRSGFPGSGTLTIYSGTNAVCADFGMWANTGSGPSQSLTIKSGASLNVTAGNFEIAYTAGPESGTLNLEDGATLTVAGYFINCNRAAPQYLNIGGAVTAHSLGFSKTSQVSINFTTANGKIVVSDIPAGDISWYANNWLPYMLDQGVAYGQAGWNLGVSYDNGQTTFSHVPEPASMILLGIGSFAMLRKRSGK